MNIFIYLLIILLIIILLSDKNEESFKSINLDTMNQNKLINFDFPEQPKIIELEKLPPCSEPIKYKLGLNQNYIWNNGEEIGMDILRSLSRNYLIYGNNKNNKRFNIRSLRISKSNILDDGKAYLLQLTLITSGENGLCDFKIVIPLEFSISTDLKLFNRDVIPQFKCCGRKYGSVIRQELEEISIFLNNANFKRYNLNSKKHLLVSDAAKISVELGLDILKKLNSEGENNILEKSSWLENDFMEL